MKKIYLALCTVLTAGIASQSFAQSHINGEHLDINNIKARVNSNGHLFNYVVNNWKSEPSFEIKNTDGKHTIHAASFWIGGVDGENKFHLSAPTFMLQGFDMFQGPMMYSQYYSQEEDTKWNRVWKVNKEQIDNHIKHFAETGYVMDEVIQNWPAHGDLMKGQSPNLAPFVDINANGIYDPEKGDYPSIKGDQAILFIYNDARASHSSSGALQMGVEVVGMAYAFNRPDDETYNNMVFTEYTIINRSGIDYKDVKLGIWTDTDLGRYEDDYIGSDVKRNSYFGYNSNKEATKEIFGTVETPFQSVTLLSEDIDGFISWDNNFTVKGDPRYVVDYYSYLNLKWKDGSPLTQGEYGKGGASDAKFMYDGNPIKARGWNELSEDHQPADRRGLATTKTFNLEDGGMKKLAVAYNFSTGYKDMLKNIDKASRQYKHQTGPFAPEAQVFANSEGNTMKPMDMMVFPNPMRDHATIAFDNPNNEKYSVTVYDLMGKQVYREEGLSGVQYQITDEKLESGIYVVELVFETRRNSTKLVVQ